MKKLVLTTLIAMFAASPAFTMEEKKGESKMDESAQQMEEMVDKGTEKVKDTFSKDDISEENTKAIQTKLSEAGFYDGEVDGKFSDSTVEGLKKFQESKNLTASGELDKETVDALGIDMEAKQAQEAAE